MDMVNGQYGIEGLGEQLQLESVSENTESRPSDVSFRDLLSGLVQQVDSLQKEADASIQGLATGETTDIHDVTVKMEEAGIAFELMMEIRNKLIEAYQQIVKMQS